MINYDLHDSPDVEKMGEVSGSIFNFISSIGPEPTPLIDSSKTIFDETSNVRQTGQDISPASEKDKINDRFDFSVLKPISGDPSNYYTQISMARALLADAISILGEAESISDSEMLEREHILSLYAHKIYKCYPFREVGDSFKTVLVIIMAVIENNFCDVLSRSQIKVLKEVTQELHRRISGFWGTDIEAIIEKFDDNNLFITG